MPSSASRGVEIEEDLATQAPEGVTLVVFHSAVLTYVTPEERQRFVRQVRNLPGHWISNEDHGLPHRRSVSRPPRTWDHVFVDSRGDLCISRDQHSQ